MGDWVDFSLTSQTLLSPPNALHPTVSSRMLGVRSCVFPTAAFRLNRRLLHKLGHMQETRPQKIRLIAVSFLIAVELASAWILSGVPIATRKSRWTTQPNALTSRCRPRLHFAK